MTCRDIIRDALRELGVIAPGDELNVDDIEVGIVRLQTTTLALVEGRGPWTTVDVVDDYAPAEGERVRVSQGASVTITLPDTVDGGGGQRRAPLDGARIAVVGTTQGVFLYRADLNAWVQADALSVDSQVPFNAVHHGGLAALLAVSLANAWPSRPTPTPPTLKRAADARAELMFAVGNPRPRLAADFF